MGNGNERLVRKVPGQRGEIAVGEEHALGEAHTY